MLTELKDAKKAVGLKQSRKAIKDGCAKRVYLAENADERLCAPIIELCQQLQVEISAVETMEKLGQACGINVGAAVAVLLK